MMGRNCSHQTLCKFNQLLCMCPCQLQQGAKQIVESWGGSLPPSAKELQKIPGIGKYTAGAIASIAFSEVSTNPLVFCVSSAYFLMSILVFHAYSSRLNVYRITLPTMV